MLLFFRFRDHVQNHLPKDLISPEDFINLRQELASTNAHFDNDGIPRNDLAAEIDINDPARVMWTTYQFHDPCMVRMFRLTVRISKQVYITNTYQLEVAVNLFCLIVHNSVVLLQPLEPIISVSSSF